MAARREVVRECTGIPRPWPAPRNGVDYTSEEIETLARRDRQDSLNCATPALIFADHIRRRDTKLSPKHK